MNMSAPGPSASIDISRYAAAIRGEQVDAIYSRLLTIAAVSAIFAPIFISYSLWDLASSGALTCWLSASVVISIGQGVLYYLYRRAPTGKVSSFFRNGLVVSALLLGAFWGSSLGYLFAKTEDVWLHVYILVFFGALGALALSMYNDYLPTFYAFLIPTAVLLSVMALWVDNLNHTVLGLLQLLAAVLLSSLAHAKNRGLRNSLAMRFAMQDMALELGRQRDVAERANVSKSKFLAAASHDLRQPLHALTLLTAALESSKISEEVRVIANDIQRAVDSLEKLFNSLLDISRLDAGVLRPERSHFPLGELLQRISAEFAIEAEAKGLRLTCELCESTVYSDPLLLERIVRNYVANAVRYTRHGGISISGRLIGSTVRIAVSDTGDGIPATQQNEIFSEFYQIGNPERDRSKGLGLGLAIVRRLAELLDHPIAVESKPGAGSTFTVTVPVGDATAVTRESVTPCSVTQHNLSGLRVVVIDDDLAVRDSVQTLLTVWGCESVVAGDAEEAICRARKRFETPDVLLADYRLRDDQTGVEAIRRLCAEFQRNIPALILSGDTAPDRLREVAASGYTLLHKPVRPAELRAFLVSVRRVLSAT